VKKITKIAQLVVFPLYKLFGWLIMHKKIRLEPANTNNVLIISNHISHFDPFLVIGQFTFKEIRRITPIYTIMTNSLLYGKPFSPFLRLIGCFPAKPRKNTLHGLEAAQNYANHGSLFFFPEGGIRGGKNATRLRSGAAVVANKNMVSVVPVFIRRDGFRFKTVSGKMFRTKNESIEAMMERVYELEKYI
jgi:1-acyl-sn-glycerol-3-phosphate acyltransferase